MCCALIVRVREREREREKERERERKKERREKQRQTLKVGHSSQSLRPHAVSNICNIYFKLCLEPSK